MDGLPKFGPGFAAAKRRNYSVTEYEQPLLSDAMLGATCNLALMCHVMKDAEACDRAFFVQAIRLVAAVIAKNAVGSSWRKTLGSREWSKVPDQEKAAVRSAAARLLLSEDSHRVSVQLGLLITNIARYFPPGKAENVLRQLLNFLSPSMALHIALLICIRMRESVAECAREQCHSWHAGLTSLDSVRLC